MSEGKRARSSVTGKFVPTAEAGADPEHTVLEAIDDMRLIHCPQCSSSLGLVTPGRIEHNDDGSHTFVPEYSA